MLLKINEHSSIKYIFYYVTKFIIKTAFIRHYNANVIASLLEIIFLQVGKNPNFLTNKKYFKYPIT